MARPRRPGARRCRVVPSRNSRPPNGSSTRPASAEPTSEAGAAPSSWREPKSPTRSASPCTRPGGEAKSRRTSTRLREKVTALQLAHSDLVQLEEGASRAVADAENHLRDTRFRHAPAIEQRLVDQVASLTEKRAELEAELGRVASAEHALRAAWQELAEAVPGCPDPIFGDAEAVPARRPTEPHPGISAYVVSADWPGWFAQVVRQAAADFGSPEAMRANGVDPERERMRREAAQPIGG